MKEQNRILSYCGAEWPVLLVVTVSGVFYNLGLLAGPWFEGRLAQCLYEVFGGSSGLRDMLVLCLLYVSVIGFVQGMRFVKRFYVRRFANHVNRSMKRVLYGNLVHQSAAALEKEDAGSILTKAISDVDACVEGMRKFVTEIFDTGVALLAYAGMLLWYDWRLGLLCMIFPPAACILAEKMKVQVEQAGRACKESAGRLNAATLDRAAGAVTYRVFGCEKQRGEDYERHLNDYEKKAVRANFWVSAMQPLYQVISMAGCGFLLWFGTENVLGSGHRVWDIGTLTTFLACYGKLAVKSSHAAKLFNAVQKAQVSWERIRPLMKRPPEEPECARKIPNGKIRVEKPCRVEAEGVSFSWDTLKAGRPLFENLEFTAKPGQIIGITGPVACGKSSLGQLLCGGLSYGGSIRINGRELRELTPEELHELAVWQGHDSALLADSIRENVLMGDKGDARFWLKAVCMEQETDAMEQGEDTPVGTAGVFLSGGQQARLALARTLAHGKGLLVLDDPFAALDRDTEERIFANLRELAADCTVLLISHRLYLFPQTDQVIWMDGGRTAAGSHEELLKTEPGYAALYRVQTEGQKAEKPETKKGAAAPSETAQKRPSGENAGSPGAGNAGQKFPAAGLLCQAALRERRLLCGIVLAAAGAVVLSLLPPLLLERIIDRLTGGSPLAWQSAAGYFGLLTLAGLTESARESLLTLFGQKITHGMRSELCGKLSRLPVSVLTGYEPGEVASRFVGDVDTLENLFTSGIISMFADACKMFSIFAVLFFKNAGLALLLLALLPLLYLFTRAVQRRMLAAQLANRAAQAKTGGQVPETIRCIRMLHVLKKEGYMREKYDRCIQEGYNAVERTNLYDAFYSPVILTVNAAAVALVMTLSAAPSPVLRTFFGMSVGTAVAVISYISQVFAPLESIGMEIQTIQSAVAGVRRINAFLEQPERWETEKTAGETALRTAETACAGEDCVCLDRVTFGYDPRKPVLREESFAVPAGGQVTLAGRTGAGKSTVFKLLLGQYRAQAGRVLVFGQDASLLPDDCKRKLFGYVEQHFYMVPGTVLEQITLFDPQITLQQAKEAARLAGVEETVLHLEQGYDTPCAPNLFSQGQWQLLAVARAVAAQPPLLLLDEITANLDAGTEKAVLDALERAARNRTVLSVSHRLYQSSGGRVIRIGTDSLPFAGRQRRTANGNAY